MEIAPRRRIDADYIAPEGRVGGIHVKDRPFGITQLHAHGQDDLPKFFSVGTWRVVARHAHHLHRKRAASSDHLACLHVGDKRLHERDWIEARMEEKPTVFVFQETGDVFRGIIVGGGKTPLSIVSNLRTEQLAVLCGQHRGIRLVEPWYGDAQKGNEKARKGY